jgi:hypothetical protein
MKHKTVEMHHIDEHGRLTHESACMSESGKPSSTGMQALDIKSMEELRGSLVCTRRGFGRNRG